MKGLLKNILKYFGLRLVTVFYIESLESKLRMEQERNGCLSGAVESQRKLIHVLQKEIRVRQGNKEGGT
jgi:hypothetical protein